MLTAGLFFGPGRVITQRLGERKLGPFLEPEWFFPYTGTISGIEPAACGDCIIMYNEDDGSVALERHLAVGGMIQQLKLDNPGMQRGWLVSMPDGYLVDTPGMVAKVSPDLVLVWKAVRDDKLAACKLPAQSEAAVGLLANRDAYYGIDHTGQPVWRAALVNPLVEKSNAGWQIQDWMMPCPSGEFVILSAHQQSGTSLCRAFASTGQMLYETSFDKPSNPSTMTFRGGGCAIISGDFRTFTPEKNTNYCISPDGTLHSLLGYGTLFAWGGDPQDTLYLCGEEYVKPARGAGYTQTWASQCDSSGQRIASFKLRGRVLGLDIDADDDVIILSQSQTSRARGVLLLGCYSRAGERRWQRVLDRFNGTQYAAELTYLRVVGDGVYIGFYDANSMSNKGLYSYALDH
jgi:hypothetical protein